MVSSLKLHVDCEYSMMQGYICAPGNARLLLGDWITRARADDHRLFRALTRPPSRCNDFVGVVCNNERADKVDGGKVHAFVIMASSRRRRACHVHNPDISPHPASLQVPELTLALRRLSDKLTLTEETLLGRTTELANALSELGKAKHEVEGAYELAARTRAREEDGKVQRRDLERRLRSAEEERKMTDNVVREYADLVRTLEGRKSATSSNTSSSSSMINGTESSKGLVDGLKDGKTGLQKLLEEFNEETEKFEKEIERLHSELEISEAKHDAESKAGERDRIELAHARAELAKLQADDNAAAKMVSRYMCVHLVSHLRALN